MSQELPDHLPWPAFDAVVPSQADEANGLVQSALHAQRGGNADEAIALYERALVLAPDRADALVQCTDLLLSLNRPHEALAKCDRALALQPQHTGLLEAREKAMRALSTSIWRATSAASPHPPATSI